MPRLRQAWLVSWPQRPGSWLHLMRCLAGARSCRHRAPGGAPLFQPQCVRVSLESKPAAASTPVLLPCAGPSPFPASMSPPWKPKFWSQKLWLACVAGSFGGGTLGPDPVPHFPRVPTAGQLLMPPIPPSASGLCLCVAGSRAGVAAPLRLPLGPLWPWPSPLPLPRCAPRPLRVTTPAAPHRLRAPTSHPTVASPPPAPGSRGAAGPASATRAGPARLAARPAGQHLPDTRRHTDPALPRR